MLTASSKNTYLYTTMRMRFKIREILIFQLLLVCVHCIAFSERILENNKNIFQQIHSAQPQNWNTNEQLFEAIESGEI